MGDAKSRSERRIRKILENSQNRLERITGRNEKPIVNDPISVPGAVEDTIDDASILGNSHRLLPELPYTFTDYGLEDVSNVTLSKNEDTENSTILTTNFIRYKVHIILLSLLANILQFSFGITLSNYFFLPLLLIEVSELCFIGQIQSNSILKTVLAFSKISPQKIEYFFMILSFIQKTMQDACLYLFSFVVFHVTMGFIVG